MAAVVYTTTEIIIQVRQALLDPLVSDLEQKGRI
jgi:hypothetical protein